MITNVNLKLMVILSILRNKVLIKKLKNKQIKLEIDFINF
jgi:hypothetical protein